MDNKMVFCEDCRRDVNAVISDAALTGTIKGVSYQYNGKQAHCADCGAPLYVPEINDGNLQALYDVYREKNGIVPLSVVLAIPEKYAIGKRPLSLLLGWGEQTFTRYCDGDIPTKQYSEILLRIYRNPSYYAELLEKGKNNLKSQHAYEKSRHAVNSLLRKTGEANSKIDVCIHYLLSQCEDITPLALQKALYYIQGFYYAFFKSFLFAENCEAWVHGPVYREIYLRYKDYHFDPIAKANAFDASVLAADEKAIFDAVIHYICCYSGKVLEQFTHNEAPWLTARGDLPSTAHSEQIISQSSIGKYFSSVKVKYNMVKPNDIRSYASDMFQCI